MCKETNILFNEIHAHVFEGVCVSTCVAVSSSVCPSRARSPTGLASFSSETVLDSFSSEVSLVSLERLARSPTGLARDRSLFHRFNFSMFRFHNLNSWCLCSSKECFHKVRKCPFLTCGKKTKKTSQNVNIEPSRAGKNSKKTPKKSLTCGKKELKKHPKKPQCQNCPQGHNCPQGGF